MYPVTLEYRIIVFYHQQLLGKKAIVGLDKFCWFIAKEWIPNRTY